MENQLLQAKAQAYIDIVDQVKKKTKWSINSNQVQMMIASMYVVHQKAFQVDRFLEVSDYIKNEVGLFSTLKSQLRFTTAAMLDLHFHHPKEAFHSYLDVYESFVDHKFQRGAFTYIAAMAHFTKERGLHPEKVERARSLYKAMRQEHPFLTTNNDYPLAVLLADVEQDDVSLMNYVEAFYAHLNELGFSKGNQLQFLSHILALPQQEPEKVVVGRVLDIKKAFKEVGLKTKQAYYPEMGMLALLENGVDYVPAIQRLVDEFKEEKSLKWQSDMNVKVATNLVVSEVAEEDGMSTTSLYTAVEAIVQAQQAAMFAAMSGTAAIAASGGDGN